MNKSVVWSNRAKKDLTEIKAFFDKRNQSSNYSNRLLKVFKNTAAIIQKYPSSAITTDFDSVKAFIVLDYIIFYEIGEKNIVILTIWDSRRNPQQLHDILKR